MANRRLNALVPRARAWEVVQNWLRHAFAGRFLETGAEVHAEAAEAGPLPAVDDKIRTAEG